MSSITEKYGSTITVTKMNDYMRFIATSRYARWLPEENRRETWAETVDRYMDNVVRPLIGDDGILMDELHESILSLGTMPSMRAMMTAGKALERDNTCAYNCSYLPVDDPKAFDEAMFILLCGTGVGFSVERQYVQKLPEVPERLFDSDSTVVVKDSKEGWAKSLRQVIALLYSGEIPKWDTSKVRPAGSRLNTFGGRASGPAPLEDLFRFTVNTFRGAAGRKLSSIEAHDLMCKIGEVVVVGGVRRSAMISLSNLSDDRMRHAKTCLMIVCVMLNLACGGRMILNVLWLTTLLVIRRNLMQRRSCESGSPLSNLSQAKEEFSTGWHRKGRLPRMGDERPILTLELTPARRLSCDPTSSVTLQKLLSDLEILLMTWSEKLDLQQSWEPSNLLIQTSPILGKNGEITLKTSVYLG